ncbi:MAG: excinuclease ABC subunit UvrB [Planctomycetota bacterium]|jgi:excinuclease ABC subunit B
MSGERFNLTSEFKATGDQPEAIKKLSESLGAAKEHQVLLGVTGSGKTFTMANVIQAVQKPTLIVAHNKTLAAQLYGEFKALFPENAVEYFVSYYDYYQPEAYIPRTDTYIEKDASINERIDKMRNAATASLLSREDVIIVASVSCIYGLGSPDAYEQMSVNISKGQEYDRDEVLRDLTRIQYQRNNLDLVRGTFRARGDVVEIFPAYEEERVIRVEFFDSSVDSISFIDPLRGEILGDPDEVTVFPASHYITPEQRLKKAIELIGAELEHRLEELKSKSKLLEAQRLEQRTRYDLEILAETGFCSGIENYSRHLDGRKAGQPPATLINYFPTDFLLFIDESHQTIPQLGAMFRGDRSRKTSLVEHGFRLPSALDNRPLRFREFEKLVNQVVYVSATPGPYEIEKTGGAVVEQVIRPTGLVDPEVEVRPVSGQVDDLMSEIKARADRSERVLVTTLTKRMAEELSEYYLNAGMKVRYLHSDVKTLERTEIIRELRLGTYDCLVGINLLREGLDIPEVSLVAILDADREGFLRSETSLIQTFGRAARNVSGRVILYADTVTRSMTAAMEETERRRNLQSEYNESYGITPQTIRKNIAESMAIYGEGDYVTVSAKKDAVPEGADLEHVRAAISRMKSEMLAAARDLEYERAAELRDRMLELQALELKYL